ncbi:hypothetical protein TrRE_jg4165, partial [Triparma retinervis]
MRSMALGGIEGQPRFLYGTHNSTAGYALYWLVRVMPEHVICLQSGRFDEPDRIFRSVEASWGVLGGGADVKELIQEFYDTERKTGGG